MKLSSGGREGSDKGAMEQTRSHISGTCNLQVSHETDVGIKLSRISRLQIKRVEIDQRKVTHVWLL